MPPPKTDYVQQRCDPAGPTRMIEAVGSLPKQRKTPAGAGGLKNLPVESSGAAAKGGEATHGAEQQENTGGERNRG